MNYHADARVYIISSRTERCFFAHVLSRITNRVHGSFASVVLMYEATSLLEIFLVHERPGMKLSQLSNRINNETQRTYDVFLKF